MNIETAKKLLTGIFYKNYSLREIDDSIFIQIIRSGIEEACDGKDEPREELLEHAIKKYTKVWLKSAAENEYEFDTEKEKKAARIKFLKYYN